MYGGRLDADVGRPAFAPAPSGPVSLMPSSGRGALESPPASLILPYAWPESQPASNPLPPPSREEIGALVGRSRLSCFADLSGPPSRAGSARDLAARGALVGRNCCCRTWPLCAEGSYVVRSSVLSMANGRHRVEDNLSNDPRTLGPPDGRQRHTQGSAVERWPCAQR